MDDGWEQIGSRKNKNKSAKNATLTTSSGAAANAGADTTSSTSSGGGSSKRKNKNKNKGMENGHKNDERVDDGQSSVTNVAATTQAEVAAADAHGDEQKTFAVLAEWKRVTKASGSAASEELLRCNALDRVLVSILSLRTQAHAAALREFGAVLKAVFGEGKAGDAASVLVASIVQLCKTYGRETGDATRAMRNALPAMLTWIRAAKIAAIEDEAAARANASAAQKTPDDAWRARFERIGEELPTLQQAVDDATSVTMKAHAASKLVQSCHERVELLQPGSDARAALSGAGGGKKESTKKMRKKALEAKRSEAAENLAKASHCIDKQITSIEVAGDTRKQQEEVQKLVLLQQQCSREEAALSNKIADMESALFDLKKQLSSTKAKQKELGDDIEALTNKKSKPLYNVDVSEMKSEIAVIQKIEGLFSSFGATEQRGAGAGGANGSVSNAVATAAEKAYAAAIEDSMSILLAQQVELANRWMSARSKLVKAQLSSSNGNLPKELRKKQEEIADMLVKQVKELVGLSGGIAKTSEDELSTFQMSCSASAGKAGRIVNVIKAQYEAMAAGQTSLDGIVPDGLATIPPARAGAKTKQQPQKQQPPKDQQAQQTKQPQQQASSSSSAAKNAWGRASN